MSERKLASIRLVDDITPIEDMKFVEYATIDGWRVVVQKGSVEKGDLVVYFEVDSWVPKSLIDMKFGKKPKKNNKPCVFKGIEGQALTSVKICGHLSQGLIMRIDDVVEKIPDFKARVQMVNGEDVTDVLGIVKWEEPNTGFGFEIKGVFPEFITKTDQERVQNIYLPLLKEMLSSSSWEITEKLDGSSMTVYHYKKSDGEVQSGVCSRNYDLHEFFKSKGARNVFWHVATKYNIIENLAKLGRNLAIQGELIGRGISGDLYELLDDEDYYVFDVWDIDNQVYLSQDERLELVQTLGLKHVPVLNNKEFFGDSEQLPDSFSTDDLLQLASRKSLINPNVIAEGIVFKTLNQKEFKNGRLLQSFKVISNDYLTKKKTKKNKN